MTQATLSKQLKMLEEYGIINRYVYNQIPPKVEYSLTERGKALLPTLDALYYWGKDQIEIDKLKNKNYDI